jgi:hypothetical protein
VAKPASGETITLDEIAAVWKRRPAAVHIEWRCDTAGVHRFQHYQSDWVPLKNGDWLRSSSKRTSEFESDEVPVPLFQLANADRRATLNIDGDRFRFETVRWTVDEHGYQAATINAASVVEMYPERKFDPYITALDSHFDDPRAELRDPRPFLRTAEENRVQDYWPPHAGDYPRGTIRRELPSGERTTKAADARAVSDDLQDLSLVGAILALCPLHSCGIVRLDQCEVAAEPALADGNQCVVVTDLSPAAQTDSKSRRTFWLDPKQDFSIRRFIAHASTGGTQVDIRYRRDDRLGWIPTEWTVSSFGEENGGRLDAARIVVMKLESRGALTDEESTVRFPTGTWVIDDPAAKQYILRPEGSRRDIRLLEFDWLPTYAELSATEPGQVGALVESQLRWKRYWQSARYPIALGVTFLASALALSLWRRRRKAVGQASPDDPPNERPISTSSGEG